MAGFPSFSARVLLCPACGAPAQVPETGGVQRCDYCGVSSHWEKRARKPVRRPPADEPARLAALRQQWQQPEAPRPPEIDDLFTVMGLVDGKLEECRQRFQAACNEGAVKREIIFWLALGLYNAYAKTPEGQTRQRAVLQTASESLQGSRWQAVLCGMLARNAARAGDIDAAEDWMEWLDPYATELDADSAYRFSRAYLDTIAGRPDQVLQVLGAQIGDIPLTPRDNLICAVLRANAHERRGDLARATAHLVEFMSAAPHLATLTGQIVTANAALQLCPRSYPAAAAQVTAE